MEEKIELKDILIMMYEFFGSLILFILIRSYKVVSTIMVFAGMFFLGFLILLLIYLYFLEWNGKI